jgi:hypothetical protein
MENTIGYNSVYKNKRLIKTDIAIDSRDRNREVNSYRKDYSDPNDYQITINKYKQFRNVISVRLIEAMIPNTQYIINNNNKWIDIILPGQSDVTSIELSVGNYTFSTLGKEIEDKLNAVVAGTPFTVILENVYTFLTSITHSSSDFTLLFETGPNSECSAAYVLGFEKKDITSSSNVAVSTYPYHLNSTKYIDLKIDEIPDLGTTIDIKENIQSQILKRIPMDIDFGKEQYHKPNDANRCYNYFNPIELSKLNIKLFDDSGRIYDSNRIDNYIILELIMLQDEAPDNLGFHPKQNDSIKDIKSKVDTLILNDSDVMISNKTDNEFLDIEENLTIDDDSKDNSLAKNKTTDIDSIVNDNQVGNDNIIDIDTGGEASEISSNINALTNSSSEIKDAYNESNSLNNISNESNDSNDTSNGLNITSNDLSDNQNTIHSRKIEAQLKTELFKDRDKITRLFEDYKLIIFSVILFIFIIFIIKLFNKNKVTK